MHLKPSKFSHTSAIPGFIRIANIAVHREDIQHWGASLGFDTLKYALQVEFGAPMEDSQAAGIWEVTSARMMLACVASNTKSIKEEDYKGPPVYNFGDFTPGTLPT